MTSPAELETGERYMQIAERWFTEGWAGNLALADGIGFLPESVHAA